MSQSKSPSVPPSILSATGLSKDYGSGFGLSPLDLSVDAGELVMLVGHNGSGKSTLLELCAGMLTPSGGEIRIVGHDPDDVTARAARSHIPDHPVLYGDLTVWEHIAYIAALHQTADWEAKAHDLLDLFRLTDRMDDMPNRFSRGMRQKVALIIGLVRPFSLLLIDEPFLGLDTPSQEALVTLLGEEAEAGTAVLVSTHQPNLVPVATRCVGLTDGEVVYDGPPDTGTITGIVHG